MFWRKFMCRSTSYFIWRDAENVAFLANGEQRNREHNERDFEVGKLKWQRHKGGGGQIEMKKHLTVWASL